MRAGNSASPAAAPPTSSATAAAAPGPPAVANGAIDSRTAKGTGRSRSSSISGANGSDAAGERPVSQSHSKSPSPQPTPASPAPSIPASHNPPGDDITTIFVVGFPDDVTDREFQNMFVFCPGFEAAALKAQLLPSDDAPLTAPLAAAALNGHTGQLKRQVIGFAKFATRIDALRARDTLNGCRIDSDRGCILKAEMAKKNLKTVHVKRQASSNQLDSAHAALVSQYANASQSAVNATLQDYAARFDLANSDAFHHSTVVGNSSNGSSTGSSALHGSSLPIAAAASGKNSKNIISIGNGHGSSAVGGSAGSGSIPRVSPISVIGSIIGSSALGGQPSSVASSTGSVLSHSSLGSSSLSALDLDNSAVSAMAGILKSSSNSAAFPRSVSTSVSPLPAASSAMAPAPVAAAAELASTATPSASASASIAVTSATSTAAAAASLSSTMRTMDDKLSLFPDIFDSSMRASFLGSYGLLNQETASPFQPSLPIDVPADYADLLDPLPSSVPSSSLFGTSASSAFNAERGGFNSFLYNSDSLLSGRFSNLSLAPGSSSLSGSGTYGNSSGGMSSGMGMGSMGMGYGNHGSGSGMGNMESSSMNIAGGGNSSHMNGMGGMGMGMGGMGNVGMNGMGNMGMSPHGDRMGGPNGNMMGGMHGASTATSQSQYLYSSSFPGTLSSTTGMVPFFSGMDQNPPCNTLYVGNLPHETMEEELRQIFSVQPGFKRLCFRMRSNGPMCFVEFDSIEYATAALFQLYGTHLSISTKGGIRLSYSKNPLGVRQHRPVTTFPAAQAAAVAAAAGLTYMPQPAAMSGMAGSLASAYGVSLPSAMSGMPGMTSMSGQVSLGDKDYRQVH